MKRNLAWFFLGLIALLGIAAAVNMSTPIYIQNSDTETVQIRVRTGAAQTAPWLEFNDSGTLKFSIPATGIIPTAYLGIQSGTNIIAADHTVTNTFSITFAAIPRVTVTGWTQGPATNAFIRSVSTTNVIVAGTATDPIHWIAVAQ